MARGADIAEAFIDTLNCPRCSGTGQAFYASVLTTCKRCDGTGSTILTDAEIDAEAIRSLTEDRTRDEYGELIEVTD